MRSYRTISPLLAFALAGYSGASLERLPRRSASSAQRRAVCFLCHFPSGHPDRELPGAPSYGVRTFLPTDPPKRSGAAVVWPTAAECQRTLSDGAAPRAPASPSRGPYTPRRASRAAPCAAYLNGAAPRTPAARFAGAPNAPLRGREARRARLARHTPDVKEHYQTGLRPEAPLRPRGAPTPRTGLREPHCVRLNSDGAAPRTPSGASRATRRSPARYCTAQASCRGCYEACRFPPPFWRCSTPTLGASPPRTPVR